jgi:hypothetical protein
MKDKDKRKLDRLLSNDPGPSVQESEVIRKNIFKKHKEIASTKKWFIWLPATSAAAACLLLMVLWLGPKTEQESFASRGKVVSPYIMQVSCRQKPESIKNESLKECRQGESLIIEVQSFDPEKLYFSAAALGPDGLLVWYFPSASSDSLHLKPEVTLHRLIELGAEHQPGDYQIFGFFSQQAPDKKLLKEKIKALLAGKERYENLVTATLKVLQP